MEGLRYRRDLRIVFSEILWCYRIICDPFLFDPRICIQIVIAYFFHRISDMLCSTPQNRRLMPKFVLKEMESLYVEEQKSEINKLMVNLESLPVSKGSTDSKYGLQKLKKYNHRWVRNFCSSAASNLTLLLLSSLLSSPSRAQNVLLSVHSPHLILNKCTSITWPIALDTHSPICRTPGPVTWEHWTTVPWTLSTGLSTREPLERSLLRRNVIALSHARLLCWAFKRCRSSKLQGTVHFWLSSPLLCCCEVNFMSVGWNNTYHKNTLGRHECGLFQ